jgi:hypothetical protein
VPQENNPCRSKRLSKPNEPARFVGSFGLLYPTTIEMPDQIPDSGDVDEVFFSSPRNSPQSNGKELQRSV